MEKVSLVICVYNERENIKPLVERISQELKDFDYELIYVDDGSTDGTPEEILSLNKKEIILIEFSKNYGQSLALAAGIERASGDFIVTLDGDLQNDPSDIPGMLDHLKGHNLDMVAGIRKNRQDGMFLRKIPSKIANYIIRSSTNVRLNDYGCTLKVFRSKIAKEMGLYGELHRFIPVLASLEGGKLGEVEVKHHSRKFGKSKYGIGRTTKVISDLLLMLFFQKYLRRPMHLFGGIGLLTLLAGMAINFYLLVLKIMGQDIWGKPLLILGVLLVFTGIQLITIGLIVELLMRIYYESQQKRPYKVKRITIGKN